MNKKILSLVLVLAMLLTSLVMVIPTSAATETVKTKGYLLAVKSEPNEAGTSSTANGLSMIFLLADGTFMIYDGGGSFNGADASHLKSQLQSISTQHGLDPNNIVVSLWMISHPHEDHVGIFKDWGSYKSGVTVKEFWYNHVSSVATNDTIYKRINALYPSTPINAVYPGEEYQYADVHMKVLYSLDQRTSSPYYNKSNYSGTTGDYTDHYGTTKSGGHADGNNSSTIVRLDIGSKSILLTGDAGWKAFEEAYTNFKSDLDVDIFQVSHHGVGSASASSGDKYSTPNNKHFAAITPTTILIPAGLGVVNMTLNGSRAITTTVSQTAWQGAGAAKNYDGYFKLYMDFGVVSAAGGMGQTFDATEFKNNQTKTANGKTYYMAGQYGVDSGIKNIQQFFTSDTDLTIFNTKPTMLEGASVRVTTKEGLEGSGIRFTSEVSSGTLTMMESLKTAGKIKSYSFGTVVFRAESLSKLNVAPTAQALEKAGETYVDIPASKGLIDKNGGKQINAAIVNIREENYGRAFAAVAYVQYVLANGKTLRVYADFNQTNNVRSIAAVAAAALNDQQAATGVVDGKNYRYAVTTGITMKNGVYVEFPLGTTKYSPYFAGQREILKKYVTAQNKADYAGDDTLADLW